MAPRKLRLKLIEKEKIRGATLKKRLQSLKKKAHEFSVLCDVDVCMIIFTPEFKDSPPNVESWPLDPPRVDAIINRYKQAMAASGSKKRTFSISDFFDMRRRQARDEITVLCKANFEAKFPTWDDRIHGFSPEQLVSCLAKLDSNIEAVKRKIMLMKGDGEHKSVQPESRSTVGGFDARWRPSGSDNFNIPAAAAALHPWNRDLSDNRLKAHAIQPRTDEALVKLSLSLNPNDKSLRMPMMNNDNGFGVQSGIASGSNGGIPNNVMYSPAHSFLDGVMFNPMSSIPVLHDPSRSSAMQSYAMFKEPKAEMGNWFNAAPSMQPVGVATYNQQQQLMMPHMFPQMLSSDFHDDFYHAINEYEMKNEKQMFF